MSAWLSEKFRIWRDKLVAKGWSYWALAALFLAASVYASPYADKYLDLTDLGYGFFQWIGETLSPRPPTPRFVKLVMIDKDEYNIAQASGPRPAPINRRYLAKLVRALDAANVAVIALDFQMHLPDPDAKGTYGDIPAAFRADTDALVAAIADAAKRRSIVLSKEFHGQDDAFRTDFYAPYGICTWLDHDGRWHSPGSKRLALNPTQQANISCGYIALTDQKSQIPPRADIDNAGQADSFSLAIVRAWNESAATLIDDGKYYTDYIAPRKIDEANIVVGARAVRLHDPKTFRTLRFKPVIIGGAWLDENANQVDVHKSPVGQASGVIIHANFAEAVLDGRVYPAIGRIWLVILEVLAGILAAAVLALYSTFWMEAALFVAMALIFLFVEYAMFIALGTFFDASVPLFGMLLHKLFERVFRPTPHSAQS